MPHARGQMLTSNLQPSLRYSERLAILPSTIFLFRTTFVDSRLQFSFESFVENGGYGGATGARVREACSSKRESHPPAHPAALALSAQLNILSLFLHTSPSFDPTTLRHHHRSRLR